MDRAERERFLRTLQSIAQTGYSGIDSRLDQIDAQIRDLRNQSDSG